jgi:drug/metabolite transporter (DMT)-like permease
LSNTLKAVFLTMGSMVLFTMLDASAKLVTQHLPMAVAVFFRYFIALALTGILIWHGGGAALLKTRHPLLQLVRGALLLGSTFCNFFAMSYLQLAQTSAIFFTIPLWVCALSVPLLGEHVGMRRWLAVVAGFCGVIVIMRPGTDSFQPAMLVSLVASLMGALYNIATRKVGGLDRVETSLLYVALTGSAVAAFPMLTHWQTPLPWQWLPLVLMGIAGTMGHFMLIQAHRMAPASTLAPFIYTQIIWMTIAGYLLFGNVPDTGTLLGAAIVVASGIYVFNRERVKGVVTTTPAPSD